MTSAPNEETRIRLLAGAAWLQQAAAGQANLIVAVAATRALIDQAVTFEISDRTDT